MSQEEGEQRPRPGRCGHTCFFSPKKMSHTSPHVPLAITLASGHNQFQRKLRTVTFSRLDMSVAKTLEFYYERRGISSLENN